jgi:hypothetical protein
VITLPSSAATAAAAPQIAWGDVPTWIAVAGAIAGAAGALGQLHAQRKEIARQARQLERQQASHIALTWCAATEVQIQPAPDPVPGAGHTVVIVSNNSSRPIRNVTCQIGRLDPLKVGSRDEDPPPDGPLDFSVFNTMDGTNFPMLRAGFKGGFLFEFIIPSDGASNPAAPVAQVAVQFIDDADLSWQIDENLHLQRLPPGRRRVLTRLHG